MQKKASCAELAAKYCIQQDGTKPIIANTDERCLPKSITLLCRTCLEFNLDLAFYKIYFVMLPVRITELGQVVG